MNFIVVLTTLTLDFQFIFEKRTYADAFVYSFIHWFFSVFLVSLLPLFFCLSLNMNSTWRANWMATLFFTITVEECLIRNDAHSVPFSLRSLQLLSFLLLHPRHLLPERNSPSIIRCFAYGHLFALIIVSFGLLINLIAEMLVFYFNHNSFLSVVVKTQHCVGCDITDDTKTR